MLWEREYRFWEWMVTEKKKNEKLKEGNVIGQVAKEWSRKKRHTRWRIKIAN